MRVEIVSERELTVLAHALGADLVSEMSAAESALVERALCAPGEALSLELSREQIDCVRAAIARGDDPLGDAFCQLRSPAVRRPDGAVYTPAVIVDAMLSWSASAARPDGSIDRVIDPGSGSGRFIVAAGRRFPGARLVAIERDPLAALITRANLAVHGMAERARVITADYTDLAGTAELDDEFADFAGRTLYIGNPPYVRHHQISPGVKQWLTKTAARYALKASQLAGLHVYFFLATVEYARPGDLGAFITAAEWLDVNYGSMLRKLFLGPLGGSAVHIIAPEAQPFPDADATGAITCFEIGARPPAIRIQRVDKLRQLGSLTAGRQIAREDLVRSARWTTLLDNLPGMSADHVELGELCRVHRGQATGANKFWIAGPHARDLPESVLYRTVTRAREIFDAGLRLVDDSRLRQVIDLPVDLGGFSPAEREAIDEFLRQGREAGVDRGYLARHRRAWWSVGLREPAPILATYMARRPPGFVRNVSGVRHLNIAHGIYPRDPMSSEMLDRLVAYLAGQISVRHGRTYAGGLTKFEPGEMQRLPVPRPELLGAM